MGQGVPAASPQASITLGSDRIGLRLDESLPFVFVHVPGAVANRAAHLQEPRADALETPGAHREPRHAQPTRDLDVRQRRRR